MIPSKARARAFLRTFLLQAGWNYDRMQHLGVAWAMLPGLERIHPPGEARVTAARRHLEYFNTHPFMAPALLGAALELEEEVAAGKRRPDEVTSFKTGIMGSYGAIGDSFFWAALRPFGAAVAVALMLLGAGPWGPLAFLVAFDAIGLLVRTYGFFAGVRLGPPVVARLARLDFAGATRRVKMGAAVMAGLVAALWVYRQPSPVVGTSGVVLAFPALVLIAGAVRRGVSPAALAVVLAIGAGIWNGMGGE